MYQYILDISLKRGATKTFVWEWEKYGISIRPAGTYRNVGTIFIRHQGMGEQIMPTMHGT